MTIKEAQKAFEKLKAQGDTEEEIVSMLYLMFQDDKITVEQLGELVELLGYELTEEFKNMSPEEQKTKGFKEDNEKD